MSDKGESDSSSSSKDGNNGNGHIIIREIYESDNAHEEFEAELDNALYQGIKTIVIEPTKLGDETARWIQVGNCLHKTAVLAGFGSLLSGLVWPDVGYVTYPLGFSSVACAAVYAVSWQFDPCCKYQVEYNIRKLQKLPLRNLASSSPVVLVRKEDTLLCGWKLYELFFK
ncbi:unnamed protein product [Owenia fusiformis]|uniref:Uncharacterized protein n=1 Tax=Owenia fusiformis TaxID=6347 RepID=A0A8J1UPK8_OWEFU|nr:unnamed protein product [Owenia fusiformis]